jgi:putative DNA primase/helicase
MFNTPSTPAPNGAQNQTGKPPVSDASLGIEDLEFSIEKFTKKLLPLVSKTESVRTIDNLERAVDTADAYDKFQSKVILPQHHQHTIQTASDNPTTDGDVGRDVLVEFSPSEVGHAERFVDYWGETTRYDAGRARWMLWRGTHWAPDEREAVIGRMVVIAKNILRVEVSALRICSQDYDDHYAVQARELQKEAYQLHNYRTISQSLKIARALPGMSTLTSQYDADPMVFNCQSGVIDLRTGQVTPHNPKQLLTKISPVRLGTPDEKCPRWMQFLSEIMCGDAELVSYLQRLVGYILSGRMDEQCFFLFYGGGANGKSTFINVIKHLMGAYGNQVDFTTFMDMNRGASPRNDLAALVGKRFVVSPEGMQGKALDEPVVKQFTGGDAMSVRFLNQEFFEFNPVGKIVLASNHLPVVKGTDHGIWRRMRLVPFLAKFDKTNADLELTAKLVAEAPAILAWAVEGTQLWLRHGLGIPSAVSAATMNYRSSMDIFQTFLDERCHIAATIKIGSQALYDAYTNWCASAGIRIPMKQQAFKQCLEERGLVCKKTSSSNVWLGIGLQTHTHSNPFGAATDDANLGLADSFGDLNFGT